MKINNGAKAEFHAHLIPKRCSAQKEGKTGTMRIISPRGALQRGLGWKMAGRGWKLTPWSSYPASPYSAHSDPLVNNTNTRAKHISITYRGTTLTKAARWKELSRHIFRKEEKKKKTWHWQDRQPVRGRTGFLCSRPPILSLPSPPVPLPPCPSPSPYPSKNTYI